MCYNSQSVPALNPLPSAEEMDDDKDVIIINEKVFFCIHTVLSPGDAQQWQIFVFGFDIVNIQIEESKVLEAAI